MSGILTFRLLFGGLQLASPNFARKNANATLNNTNVPIERIQKTDVIQTKLSDESVILVKSSGSTPTDPSSVGKPNGYPIGGTTPGRVYTPHVNPYRVAPKGIDKRLRAAVNPSADGAEFDDTYPAPKEKQSQESKTYDHYSMSKKQKKQLAEQCELDDNLEEIYILPETGLVVPNSDSTIPVESLLDTSAGLKKQYKKLQKDPKALKQASSTIKKLADSLLKIDDKNVKKIAGIKTIYEAKTRDTRVYFKKNGDTVQIMAPCLKIDQTKSIGLLKKYFD